MRRVLCFGEVLIDFLNTGNRFDDELPLKTFTQFPGGAPANAAVAVAKLGGRAAFAGQVGCDHFGHFLIDALNRYQVDTEYVSIHPSANTPLAFVFLDDDGERSFAFVRDRTADVVMTRTQVSEDWFHGEPIVHLCSNTLTEEGITSVTGHLVDRAESHGCFISIDVNLRSNLWPRGEVDSARVTEFVRRAQLVKFAREELEFLSAGREQHYLNACFEAGVKLAIVTDGKNTLRYYSAKAEHEINPPKVDAVDTTGGGDAFIGAVLFGMSQVGNPQGFLAESLDGKDAPQLEALLTFASRCGALAVSRQGAFPAFPAAEELGAELFRAP
ncbi:MAG: carbohydrate kinase [Pseudomonadota bacterium]